MDPVCVGDEETIRLKELVSGVIAEIDSYISMHDFRIVKGTTHTNIIFDVVVPFRFKMTDEELISTITAKIQALDASYFAVIEVDKQTAASLR